MVSPPHVPVPFAASLEDAYIPSVQDIVNAAKTVTDWKKWPMTAATETDRIQKVTMPKWGLSMESGKVTEWLVAVGDDLSQGQEICEIDTDKIAGELESTWSGVVRALVVGVTRTSRSAAPSRSSPTPTCRRKRSTPRSRRPRATRLRRHRGRLGPEGRHGRRRGQVDLAMRCSGIPNLPRLRWCSCTATAATRTRGCSCRNRSPPTARPTQSTCPGTARRARTSATAPWPVPGAHPAGVPRRARHRQGASGGPFDGRRGRDRGCR